MDMLLTLLEAVLSNVRDAIVLVVVAVDVVDVKDDGANAGLILDMVERVRSVSAA